MATNNNTMATNNNTMTTDIAAFEKYVNMLGRASRSLDEDAFYYEFGMYPERIAELQKELEALKQSASATDNSITPEEIASVEQNATPLKQSTSNKVDNSTPAKLNARKLRAAVKREVLNLLYPTFSKTRITRELRSEVFSDLSAFHPFFDSNYNLLFHLRHSFQDEVYRRIME